MRKWLVFVRAKAALRLGCKRQALKSAVSHVPCAHFESVPATTHARFKLHALEYESAISICSLGAIGVPGFIGEKRGRHIAYFSLNANASEIESASNNLVDIGQTNDKNSPFAHSIADAWEVREVASQDTPAVVAFAKAAGVERVVLFGGIRAITGATIAS